MKKNCFLILLSMVTFFIIGCFHINAGAEVTESETALSIQSEKYDVDLNNFFNVILSINNPKDTKAVHSVIQYDEDKIQLLDVEADSNVKITRKKVKDGKIDINLEFKDLSLVNSTSTKILKLKYKGICKGKTAIEVLKGTISNCKSIVKTLDSANCKGEIVRIGHTEKVDVSYTCLGNAVNLSDGSIRLTTTACNQDGGICINNPIDVSKGFLLKYDYYMGRGNSADGIAVSFGDVRYTLGGYGGAMGFKGKYGVEFDSYPNPFDPGYKHIAVINNPESHLAAVKSSKINDSVWHRAAIKYEEGNLEVYVDDELVLKYSGMKLNGVTYIGISGATGTHYDIQSIKNVEIYEY